MKVLKIKGAKTLKEAIKIIKQGGVVVCPTDTVYGLISDATNKKAVEKIFKIKKRAKEKFLPLFVDSLRQAKEIAEISLEQEKTLKRFWPGKITVVLKRKKIKTKIYGISEKTVALRIPKHKLVINLINNLKIPLAETSVNLSGQPAIVKIKEIIYFFKKNKHKSDLIIDAGNLKTLKSSRVIDLSGEKIKILRK